MTKRPCDECGAFYEPYSRAVKHQRYCSKTCRDRSAVTSRPRLPNPDTATDREIRAVLRSYLSKCRHVRTWSDASGERFAIRIER